MNLRRYTDSIVNELHQTLHRISIEQTEKLVDLIEHVDTIFVCGAGRSGFMARAFAMRLMHAGKKVYMAGETVTPNLKSNDLLIVCSGSGETKSLTSMAQKAKALQAKIALVTIDPNSTIAKLSDVCVTIEAPSPKTDATTSVSTIQPMGNLFEQSMLLYLDMVIMLIMDREGLTGPEMFKNHANLE